MPVRSDDADNLAFLAFPRPPRATRARYGQSSLLRGRRLGTTIFTVTTATNWGACSHALERVQHTLEKCRHPVDYEPYSSLRRGVKDVSLTLGSSKSRWRGVFVLRSVPKLSK